MTFTFGCWGRKEVKMKFWTKPTNWFNKLKENKIINHGVNKYIQKEEKEEEEEEGIRI